MKKNLKEIICKFDGMFLKGDVLINYKDNSEEYVLAKKVFDALCEYESQSFNPLVHLASGGKIRRATFEEGRYWVMEGSWIMQYKNGRRSKCSGEGLINHDDWEEYHYTSPSINWDHVSEEYQWLCVHQDGTASLCTKEPCLNRDHGVWYIHHDGCEANHFISFKRGDVPWNDSLVKRPENV